MKTVISALSSPCSPVFSARTASRAGPMMLASPNATLLALTKNSGDQVDHIVNNRV